jgi:hypothetical protein
LSNRAGPCWTPFTRCPSSADRVVYTEYQRYLTHTTKDILSSLPLRGKLPLGVKARCAYYILDQTKKAVETEEMAARVAELERITETLKPEK